MAQFLDQNVHRTTAVKYLGAMAALMVATAWLAVSDHNNRKAIESTVLPTALGDGNWHPSGVEILGGPVLGAPAAHFKGKPLYYQTRSTREAMAQLMVRIGETDIGGYGIFQPGEKLADSREGWYLLTGVVDGKPDRGLFREVRYTLKYGGGQDSD